MALVPGTPARFLLRQRIWSAVGVNRVWFPSTPANLFPQAALFGLVTTDATTGRDVRWTGLVFLTDAYDPVPTTPLQRNAERDANTAATERAAQAVAYIQALDSEVVAAAEFPLLTLGGAGSSVLNVPANNRYALFIAQIASTYALGTNRLDVRTVTLGTGSQATSVQRAFQRVGCVVVMGDPDTEDIYSISGATPPRGGRAISTVTVEAGGGVSSVSLTTGPEESAPRDGTLEVRSVSIRGSEDAETSAFLRSVDGSQSTTRVVRYPRAGMLQLEALALADGLVAEELDGTWTVFETARGTLAGEWTLSAGSMVGVNEALVTLERPSGTVIIEE